MSGGAVGTVSAIFANLCESGEIGRTVRVDEGEILRTC